MSYEEFFTQVRTKVPQERYTEFVEKFRRASIWAQVYELKQQLGEPKRRALEKTFEMFVDVDEFDLMTVLAPFIEQCVEDFIKGQKEGEYPDKGKTFLKNCLASFGETWDG